jgi:hypothetical protein
MTVAKCLIILVAVPLLALLRHSVFARIRLAKVEAPGLKGTPDHARKAFGDELADLTRLSVNDSLTSP